MMNPMAQQSRVGELLAGKYRLDTLLGSGGVGDVYRAQNTLIGRTVAIKLLKPEHATDDNVVTRFLREAKAANLARHPNVVDVLDVGRDEDGIPFIVQEFLEGIDLGEKLRQTNGPLPSRTVLDLMIPVVEAVGLAHARGVVHRDLKPENVFLALVDGKVVPKLLDFGISYIKPQPGDIRMTKTGMTVGTPAYMSPEQLEGTVGVDVRTDVWALGVILYEALAGRLPFEGETSALMFAQIAWVDPMPLREAAPYVPEALAQVVGRCLQRKLPARYPSAAELARDLVHVREGRPIEPTHRRSVAPPPSTKRGIPYEPTQLAAPRPVSNPDVVPVAVSIDPPVKNPMQNSGIALATLRPPPGPEQPAPAAPEDSNVFEVWTGSVVFVAVALLIAGLWMTLIHDANGWPAQDWLMNTLGGPGTPAALIVALASVGGAAWMVVHLVRNRPRLWGALVSVLGLALFAVPVVSTLSGGADGPVDGSPSLWGWSVALAAAGMGFAAGHQAWSTWSRGDAIGKALGIALVVAGTTALLIAFEVVRAVVT